MVLRVTVISGTAKTWRMFLPLLGGEGWGEGGRSEINFLLCRSLTSRYSFFMPDIARARALRRRPTWAEKLVWSWLRDRRFSAYKFRRNHPIGIYCLDFYCREASLSIELDGGGHGHPVQQAHDAVRTKFLTTMGIKELRFWNGQLRREQQVIRDTIFRELQKRAPHPVPDYTRPMMPPDQREKDAGERNARPHPNPLPRGEGTASDAFR